MADDKGTLPQVTKIPSVPSAAAAAVHSTIRGVPVNPPLSGAIARLPDGSMAEKVHILGKKDACPLLEGYNLFTGDYNMNFTVNYVANTQSEWEQGWKVLGKTPPGKLPENSRAVFEAVKKAWDETTISIRPERIETSGNGIHIDWSLSSVSKKEDLNAHASYSVLLLPKKGALMADFKQIFPWRDRLKKMESLEKSYQIFNKGSTRPLPAPPRAAFRKPHRGPRH